MANLRNEITSAMESLRETILEHFEPEDVAMADIVIAQEAAKLRSSLQTQFSDWGKCGDVPKARLFRAWARSRNYFSVGEAIEFYATLGSKRLAQFMVVEIEKAGGKLVARGPRHGVYSRRSTWSIP